MSHNVYRATKLGSTLEATLDELRASEDIDYQLMNRILAQFDRSMSMALKNRVKGRLGFKSVVLDSYKYCDNTWHFNFSNVEFREIHNIANVDKVRVVAFDSTKQHSDDRGTNFGEFVVTGDADDEDNELVLEAAAVALALPAPPAEAEAEETNNK